MVVIHMDESKSKNVVAGALLLTVAGLIGKVLSAAYRIPLQNLTGDLGFFVYQQVYPLIGIMMILSLYGFPVAISSLSVQLRAKGYAPSWQTFYLPLLIILLCMNGLIALGLFLFALPIAEVMGVGDIASALKIIAFAFLCIPFLALLRGGFQGNGEMKQTARSQIVEQLARVMLIITASILVYKGSIDVYKMADVGAVATLIGMICAIVTLLVFALSARPKPFGKTLPKIPWVPYVKACFSLGIVAASIHMILLITQLADVLTLVPDLIEYGFTAVEAMEMKGVFDRGQPLIQFGAVIGSSFALALVPSLHKQIGHQSLKNVSNQIGNALALNVYIAVGATIGLIILFPEVNRLLFRSTTGTNSLQILVLAIILSSLAITVCTILQGVGYIRLTAYAIFATFVMKYGLNRLLVPSLGITGASLATVVSLLMLCLLLIFLLRTKVASIKLTHYVNVRTAIVASVGMIGYLFVIKGGAMFITIPTRFGLLIYVLFVVVTGALCYLSLLIRYHAFTDEQLAALPFSRYLIPFAQMIRKK